MNTQPEQLIFLRVFGVLYSSVNIISYYRNITRTTDLSIGMLINWPVDYEYKCRQSLATLIPDDKEHNHLC